MVTVPSTRCISVWALCASVGPTSTVWPAWACWTSCTVARRMASTSLWPDDIVPRAVVMGRGFSLRRQGSALCVCPNAGPVSFPSLTLRKT